MSLTPEQVAENLNDLARLIAEKTPDMTQELALTGKALIQERIQESGVNEELVSFPPYTDEYKKRKEKKGKYRGFRDLTLSGDMWRKTQIKSASVAEGGYVVIIGGTTEDSQNKLNYNAEIIGDFMKLGEGEDNILREDYDEMLDKLISESGLG